MLKSITINNFAIVENLELDFQAGMSSLTGETGAGKSILIDALQYALGARADASMVRHGADRASISVMFDVQNIPAASEWLQAHELDQAHDCLLRRTINADGRSKHFVNGQASTQTQVRELGELLINIHGQHENQNLSKGDKQQQLLDDFAQSTSFNNKKQQQKALDKFAKHGDLLVNVQNIYQQWQRINQEMTQLRKQDTDQARIELLQYQIQELAELGLSDNELDTLTAEHKQLANADDIIADSKQALNIIYEDDDVNALSLLTTAQASLNAHRNVSKHIESAYNMLSDAVIQVQEAASELQDYTDGVEANPERLVEVEQRLSQIHGIARKHHVDAEQLPALHDRLSKELDSVAHADKHLKALEQERQKIETDYQTAAKQLSASRAKAAKTFNQQVTANIQQLGMPNGQFEVKLTLQDKITETGLEKIEFLVSANPGQPLKPLTKVASGGEISRISLAIQVITAQADNTPSLIFDEVDVGIGGGTAEIVGKLLRQLGERAQVLCITHLAQVAAQGNHHLQVQKQSDKKTTQTRVVYLSDAERIQEIARMLGGIKITEQTLAHAKEMLEIE
tara:strand:+ start:92152 stop:93867 length:1716 start_codon:yes stop_codon:yes gene_type:complete